MRRSPSSVWIEIRPTQESKMNESKWKFFKKARSIPDAIELIKSMSYELRGFEARVQFK